MDERSGTAVLDHTFSGNDGELSTGATWPASGDAYAGQFGVNFDGVSGQVQTSWGPVDTAESFSVSAWVKLVDRDGWQAAVTMDGVATTPFGLVYDPGADRFCFHMIHLDITEPGAERTSACAAQAPQLGAWTHLVGVFDRQQQQVSLYVDGEPAATSSYQGLQPWAAQGPLVIGRGLRTPSGGTATPSDWWHGGIALVRAYQGVLDGAGVAQLYEQQHDPTPVLVIDASATGWSAGEQIEFSGQASDPSGPLPASGLSWRLLSRDCADPADSDCQVQVLDEWSGVAGGSFTAPAQPEPVWLVLELTAAGDGGSQVTTTSIAPETVQVTFETDPEGLELTVGQVTTTTPFAVWLVRGATVGVSAGEFQAQNEATLAFDGWSHGGQASHELTVPALAATFVASYREFDLTPRAVIEFPTAEQEWTADEEIHFSGSASNTEGELPVGALTWRLWVEYCVAPGDCHMDPLQQWQGTDQGMFTAPDLPYEDAVLVLELVAEARLADIATVELHRAPEDLLDPDRKGRAS